MVPSLRGALRTHNPLSSGTSSAKAEKIGPNRRRHRHVGSSGPITGLVGPGESGGAGHQGHQGHAGKPSDDYCSRYVSSTLPESNCFTWANLNAIRSSRSSKRERPCPMTVGLTMIRSSSRTPAAAKEAVR